MVLDTDIVIRFLTNDDPEKADRFEAFLALGERITLTDVTFAEIYWTLKSFYSMDKHAIIELLTALIHESSIDCNHTILQQTLEVLKKHNLSYIDAYTVASAINSDGQVLSYDRGFDNVPNVTRKEP